ncbi:MAG: hypothetical protein PHV59_07650, partial [Victivallales bacterium]|nr:hypothetical protein [Victivallales bacterium]
MTKLNDNNSYSQNFHKNREKKNIWLLLVLFGLAGSVFGGEWHCKKQGTSVVLQNENGLFRGPQKAVLYIVGPEIRGRKTFDLEKLPPGVLAEAVAAKLRIYGAVYDYSWKKHGAGNGFSEEIAFKINSGEIILKTADPRLPAKKSKNDPLHFGWVDIDFPVKWIENNKLVVEFGKRPSPTGDDYFYPALDITVPNTASEVSTNGGKSWKRAWGNLGENGEYMLRLVLVSGDGRETETFTPGSDFSTDFFRKPPLELSSGVTLEERQLKFSGQPGAMAVIPDSKAINITAAGMTLTCTLRFQDKTPQTNNMMIFFKNKEFFLGRTGDRFNLSLGCDGKSWSQALVGGKTPHFNQWVHLAAVVERVNEPSQGNVGYRF